MAIIRGILVGALGGIAGAGLMSQSYKAAAKLMPKTPSAGEDATEKVANAVATKFTGRRLGRIKKKMSGQIVHLAFGAGMGALYGLLAERLPAVRAGGGVLLGTSLYLGAHGVAVPALGLAPSPVKKGPAQESPEFAAHLVYGFVTEAVRRLLS
jgi:uncharacterized membrane protein YagU involved in acid resistance